MKVYLVGGAVRDKLLGIPVKDQDWVVIGSSPDEMISQGFQPVGQDFPVFLHPKTKEEYALARTERKSGHGYSGFTFHTSPDVTLEEDLIRRDLTINAMAEDESGNIVDPYNGQQDLVKKQLRHVSPAFQEDPLRILRVARFAARFHHLGFSVADETNQLMKVMVAEGEASFLVAERVWQETERALTEASPDTYFTTLAQCDALSAVLPELQQAASEQQVINALRLAAANSANTEIRLALCFVFEGFTSKAVKAFASRIKLPSSYAELAGLAAEQTQQVHETLSQLSGESLVSLFEKADAFRKPDRFSQLLEVAVIHGEITGQPIAEADREAAHKTLNHCRTMSAQEFVKQGFKGREIGEQLRIARVKQIDALLAEM